MALALAASVPQPASANECPGTQDGKAFYCIHCSSKRTYKRDMKRHYKLNHSDVTVWGMRRRVFAGCVGWLL